MSLVIDGLTKSYGTHNAISDLRFTVPEGVVFGLLGLNGAGKSTTIRIILDIVRTCRSHNGSSLGDPCLRRADRLVHGHSD